jgi:hypothetical protein
LTKHIYDTFGGGFEVERFFARAIGDAESAAEIDEFEFNAEFVVNTSDDIEETTRDFRKVGGIVRDLPAVLSVEVREAYFHCGKALMRSKLWTAERVERKVMPSIGDVIHDQTGLGERESQDVIYERYKTQL